MAAEQNRRPERLRQELAQDGTLSALEESLKENKVLDNLLAKAEVVEVAPAAAAEPAAREGKKPSKSVSAKKASPKPAPKTAKGKGKGGGKKK
jgi:hypothetical protein